MKRPAKDLDRALAGFGPTGDADVDVLLDVADGLTQRFAVPAPPAPAGRAFFIEGVAARKRSFLSSLAAPAMGVAALMIVIALLGRSALPGESLYPVRKVLRSAGLASSPTAEIDRHLDEAELLVVRAQAAYERGGDGERFAVAALMSLGRAEGLLTEVDASDRLLYEARLLTVQRQAVALLSGDTDDDRSGRDSSRSGDDSGDSSGPGSGDDSDGDDSDNDDSDDDDSDDDGSDVSDSDADSHADDDDDSDSSGPGSRDRDSDGGGSDDRDLDDRDSGLDDDLDKSGPGSGDDELDD